MLPFAMEEPEHTKMTDHSGMVRCQGWCLKRLPGNDSYVTGRGNHPQVREVREDFPLMSPSQDIAISYSVFSLVLIPRGRVFPNSLFSLASRLTSKTPGNFLLLPLSAEPPDLDLWQAVAVFWVSFLTKFLFYSLAGQAMVFFFFSILLLSPHSL